jgi:hypothetical protein
MMWSAWRGYWSWGLALMSAQTAQADELRAPQYVQAEPSTPQSMALTTRAAVAAMNGNPEQARNLAARRSAPIRAIPGPTTTREWRWLSWVRSTPRSRRCTRLRNTSPRPIAGGVRSRSTVALTALSQAGRCVEAVQAFAEYATYVGKDDPPRAAWRAATPSTAARPRRRADPPPAAPPRGQSPRRALPVFSRLALAERSPSPRRPSAPPSRHCGSGSEMDPCRWAA